VDPFFFKPYQPAQAEERHPDAVSDPLAAAVSDAQLAQAAGHDVALPSPRFAPKSSARPLAALLGGSRAAKVVGSS